MKIVRLVLWWGATVVTALAQPLPFDPTRLDDAAQDGTGRVWAIARDSGLHLWNGVSWQEQSLTLPNLDTNRFIPIGKLPGARPILLQTNYQGDVIVFWSMSFFRSLGNEKLWLTKLHGASEPVSASSRASIVDPMVSFHPNGTGWITQPGPAVYRINPDLTVELAYTIHSNQMAGIEFDLYNPVRATVTAQGRLLFWGEQRFRELATLRGLLIVSEGRPEHFPNLEGLPDRGFSALAIQGSDVLWVGLPYWDEAAGLYELNLKTMRASRASEPAPDAFAFVTGIYPTARDLYVVAGDRGSADIAPSLWRRRDGVWKKLLSPLDCASFDGFYRVTRPFLPGPTGVWIGTGGNGLAFIPQTEDRAIQIVDWRKGQSVESVHRLAQLNNGELLMIGFRQGTTHASPAELLKGRSISPRVVDVWASANNLQRDHRGNLWTVRSEPLGQVLSEWDGEDWQDHPIPESILKGGIEGYLGMDSLGRFWVRHWEHVRTAERKELWLAGKVAIFVPATSDWLHFDSLEQALTDSVRKSAAFQLDLPGQNQPMFTSRGEVCFLAMDRELDHEHLVHYFDGKGWRRWDLPAVGFTWPGYAGLPFFTPEGRLAINICKSHRPGETRVFDGQRWVSAPFISAGKRDPINLTQARARKAERPGDGEIADGSGGSWSASRQQLFYSAQGISLPQFESQDVHPFIGSRRINQVWVDAKGNIVLSTSFTPDTPSYRHRYVVFAPPAFLPGSTLDMVKLKSSGIELQFATASRQTDSPLSSGTSPVRTPLGNAFTAVELHGDSIVLRWEGAGVLQAAESMEGPWLDLSAVTSPHTVLVTKPTEFFRVRPSESARRR